MITERIHKEVKATQYTVKSNHPLWIVTAREMELYHEENEQTLMKTVF